jgi:hypothetical protein
MLLLYAIPVGLLVGLAAGGRIGRLAQVRIRLAPLAVAGLLFQLVLFSPPVAAALGSVGHLGPVLYVGSTTAVLVALSANFSRPGLRVVFVGAALNLIVILLNDGFMPASPTAWAAVHGPTGVPADVLTNSVLADGTSTALAFLGDIFYLPRPLPFANVFSIGDALIAAGGAWFIARTTTDRRLRVEPAMAASAQPRPAHG